MLVFLNGQFVPEERAVISVFDRSFLYGDGLFEVVRIGNGRPFRWAQHWERFAHGAVWLKIQPPFSSAEVQEFAGRLIVQNKMPDALLRLTLSRGVGPRGYSPKGADAPTFVVTLHPVPDPQTPPRWKLVTASQRLSAGEPLAQFKNANKLPQILARAQADEAGADEALLSNTDGWVVEGTTSNLFWIEHGAVCTPPLAAGILPGVTRAVVLELCLKLNLPLHEKVISPDQLRFAGGIFLSMSSWGVVEVSALDGQGVGSSPLVAKIRAAYAALLRAECA